MFQKKEKGLWVGWVVGYGSGVPLGFLWGLSCVTHGFPRYGSGMRHSRGIAGE